jgi:hypothetical protein
MVIHRNQGLACIVLRTSRFFPEADDDKAVRDAYEDGNVKANEFLYRRVDIEDVVSAHMLAVGYAPALGFGRYIISATTPFFRNTWWTCVPMPCGRRGAAFPVMRRSMRAAAGG